MRRSSERGSGRVQFFIVMTIIVATAYAGYLYVPVAYNAHEYTSLMQHYADASGAQERPLVWVEQQLRKDAADYQVPENAVITPVLSDSQVVVRVQFVKPIEFPGYTYNYEFDRTVKSTAFMAFK
jgi:hypothetical protein